jgi:AhpD family alkylhydroperoxidase
MTHPVMVLPGAMPALLALNKATGHSGLPPVTALLVQLRVSQINGCSWCTLDHGKNLTQAGESVERVFCVAAWREAPFYTDAERAALELAEALTRIADQPDPIDDELWARLGEYYDEAALSALLIQIAQINAWNRLNVAIRQVAGT